MGSYFGSGPDLNPAATVAKRVAKVEERLQFATQGYGKDTGQHSCGTVVTANHVLIGQEGLGMGPHFGSG